MKCVLVAGPGTGAGKTTITVALMAALRKRGLRVQPFKCGPDFIDPGHHAMVCGRPSHNLDTWMLSAEANRRIFASACCDADIAIIEGMMGLFDGVGGNSDQGSSAEIAKLLGLPVLLVVDAGSSARSVAALVHGFKSFDPRTRVVGAILNRVAGAAHAEMLTAALGQADKDLIVGWVPEEKELRLPERYLGLQTAREHSWTGDVLDLMSRLIERHCPLDRLLEVCEVTLTGNAAPLPSLAPGVRARIGVARDRAFCFYYEAGLDELRRQGAEICEFSPLACASLPQDLDGLYFGGGYPELYVDTLSNKTRLLSDLREFARAGKPIYGECGGLMFLSRQLITQDGARWPMAGLLPLSIEMTDGLVHFGYADIEFIQDGLAVKGTRLRGHSFHCSKIFDEGAVLKTALVHYSLSRQSEQEGFRAGNVFGSYVHVHFAADPSLAARFVALACSHQKSCREAS
jgi:cobyrinic acid a,c-diamide synthase